MNIILLAGAYLLFFICNSLISTQTLLILNSIGLSKPKLVFCISCGYIGGVLAVNIYDIAKRTNIIKAFIISVLLLQCSYLTLQSLHDFPVICVAVMLIYASSQVADLCCNVIGQYIPLLPGVLLRNVASLIASYINALTYATGNARLITYINSISIASILCTNVTPRTNVTPISWNSSDIWTVYREYTDLFWCFLCTNVLEILLLRHCVFITNLLNNNIQYASNINIAMNLGRIVLHFPLVYAFNKYSLNHLLFLLQFANVICITTLPVVFEYKMAAYAIVFCIGGLTLLRHGITMLFTRSLKDNNIAPDIVFNKLRATTFFISFVLELIIVTQSRIATYIIILVLAIANIYCSIHKLLE
jgi:hypothetical protein